MTESDQIPPGRGGEPNEALCIHVTVRMLIPAGKRREARDILASMIERIRLAEGCLSCHLYQDALEGNVLMFEETWENEDGFRKHLHSDEFRNVLLVVEMASAPPDIRFDRIARSSGLGTIKDMR